MALLRVPVAIVLVACALAGCASATPPEFSRGCRPGTRPAATAERGELDGRAYLVDAPAGRSDRALPLVMAFHGFRGDPADLRAGTRLGELAESGVAIVAYPSGHDDVMLLGTRGRGWDMRPDQTVDRTFVSSLLDRLEGDHCVDRRRIYLTGFSNGGFVASLLGCQLADRVAAVAPVSGALDLGACAPARPVPIIFLYGSADRVVEPELIRRGVTWWEARNGCSGSDGAGGCARSTGCAAAVVACEGPQGTPLAVRCQRAESWRFFQANPRP